MKKGVFNIYWSKFKIQKSLYLFCKQLEKTILILLLVLPRFLISMRVLLRSFLFAHATSHISFLNINQLLVQKSPFCLKKMGDEAVDLNKNLWWHYIMHHNLKKWRKTIKTWTDALEMMFLFKSINGNNTTGRQPRPVYARHVRFTYIIYSRT